ncbi:XAC0095 family protein [Sphingomonas canadensis]|uniref:XAC0095 family protein n=1 Tax=Sphingomonas canadensis TaxID=1219257 RepID=A0ABW3HAN8_9SPHN|nr:hypothetical protein [Sphingomonas canadensis]MCW3837805.1 hypothetical protein [Sphingomonas canadensis]
MPQAARPHIHADPVLEAHYALSDAGMFELHLLRRSLAALATLTCPEGAEEAHHAPETPREDLGALFLVLGRQLGRAIDGIPAVSGAIRVERTGAGR